MSEWISVDKRLPIVDDDGIEVLIYCDGEISIGWYGLESYETHGIPTHWHVDGNLHPSINLITHWMPLPNPPIK